MARIVEYSPDEPEVHISTSRRLPFCSLKSKPTCRRVSSMSALGQKQKCAVQLGMSALCHERPLHGLFSKAAFGHKVGHRQRAT